MMRFRESYWEIEQGKELAAFEEALEAFGAKYVANALANFMDDRELGECLDYIFKFNLNDYEKRIGSGESQTAYQEVLRYLGAEDTAYALMEVIEEEDLGRYLARIFKRKKFDSAYLK